MSRLLTVIASGEIGSPVQSSDSLRLRPTLLFGDAGLTIAPGTQCHALGAGTGQFPRGVYKFLYNGPPPPSGGTQLMAP